MIPNIIASPEAILGSRQKELGVVAVDIGHSATNMSVYENGALLYSAVIPIGGEHVTSDIAIGLRISIDLAERVKIENANVGLNSDDQPDVEVDLSKLSKTEDQVVSQAYISEIARARYEEILFHISNNLRNIGKDGMLPEGVVLLGGGAKMRGLIELTKARMRLPASLGVPRSEEFIAGTSIADPSYASLLGVIILSRKYARQSHKKTPFQFDSWIQSAKSLFSKLLP